MNGWLFAVAGGLLLAVGSVAAQQPSALPSVLDGVFTAGQAARGEIAFNAQCGSCHDGPDVDGPPLSGTPFIDRWREDKLAGLFEFIKIEMPQRAPGSLSDAEYLDILAYLLDESHFPAGPRELTMAAVNSTLLVGPNGPQPLPSGAIVGVVGCLTQNASREWVLARGTAAARVRVGDEISLAEATAAAGAAIGTQTFTLQNVGADGIALPGEAHKVLVKGALSQRAGGARIHVTAAKSVAATCG
jgi:mono/diheme cytochrome c family protein